MEEISSKNSQNENSTNSSKNELDLNPFFKSIIEQDKCAVVVCSIDHTIIYMNPAAKKIHEKHGDLIGKSILDCHNEDSKEKIIKTVLWFSKSEKNNIIHTFFNEKQNKDGYMIALRDDDLQLIGYYEKHEFRTKDETPFYNY